MLLSQAARLRQVECDRGAGGRAALLDLHPERERPVPDRRPPRAPAGLRARPVVHPPRGHRLSLRSWRDIIARPSAHCECYCLRLYEYTRIVLFYSVHLSSLNKRYSRVVPTFREQI